MRYRVTQAFASPLRRFRIGDEIAADQIDGPVPAARWRDLGYLAEADGDPAIAAPPDVVAAEVAEEIGDQPSS